MSTAPRAYRLDNPDVDTGPAAQTAPVPGTAPFATPLDGTEGGRHLPGHVRVTPEAGDIVDDPAVPEGGPDAGRRGFPWGPVFISALSGLAMLGIGLWVEKLITQLFAMTPGLGYAAAALAAVAVLAFLGILGRETLGLLRERRIERLRAQVADAHGANDDRAARALVKDLIALYASRPETARARGALEGIDETIIDGRDRLSITERELMMALDRDARRAVAQAAKQVSLVTTISPRAIVDVGFVLYSSFRLVRRLAAIYGGRPGFFGFLRLARNVLTHLAVTGGMAAGDSLIQQVMGLGLAARVSAKLGEGVLNGMLTARVGLAAIEVCRPMPFLTLPAPSFTEVAGHLLDSNAGTPPARDT